jgi:hypothetical protein
VLTQTTKRRASGNGHVRYTVDNVEAIGFYRDRLGFRVEMQPAPGFASPVESRPQVAPECAGIRGSRYGGRCDAKTEGMEPLQIEVEDLEKFANELLNRTGSSRGSRVERREPCQQPGGTPGE